MTVAGYIHVGRGFNGLRKGDESRLTHVNFSFAVIRDGLGSVSHWENTDVIRDFMKNRGNIKAILSVGGWGAGGFSNAVATKEGREKLTDSLVDIINDYGFDGIDLDWEYPANDSAGIDASPNDTVNYTLWVELIREKIGQNKILSMAAGAGKIFADALEIKKLVLLMDFFNIMTYDMCPWNETGYHTSLYPSDICKNRSGSEAMQVFLDAGIPKEKLVLGAAFYGRIYKDVDGLGKKATTPPGFTGGYVKTMEMVEQAGGYLYDEKAEAPYSYNEKERTFITFENEKSLKAKVKYVKEQNFLGIMFWEYTCDDENSTLLKAIC